MNCGRNATTGDPSSSWVAIGNDIGEGVAFTLNSPANVQVSVEIRTNVTNKIFAPMIRKANILDDTYEPYFGSTAFPRSEQAVLGAKNWFNYTKVTTENNGVTFTNSNNQSCTLSGQATADQAAIEMGTLRVDKDTEFIFNGASSSNNAKIHMYVLDATTNARPYTNSSKTTLQSNNCFGTGANSEIPFFAEAGHVIRVYARVQTTGTSVPSNTVFWPMVRLASDPDDTYVPYAMTNRELTDMLSLTEHTVTGTTDANGLLVASNIPQHPIIYCFGAPSGGGNCYAEARPGGGGITFYLHNAGTKIASTEVTVHYYDFVK